MSNVGSGGSVRSLRYPLGSARDLAPAIAEPDAAEQERLKRMASPEDVRRSEVTIAELVRADPRAAEAPVPLTDFDPDALDDVSRETSEYEDGEPRGAGNPTAAAHMRSIARRVAAAGGRVKESPGWASRGRSSSFTPRYAIEHHTAAPRDVDALLIGGRGDLPGPLCNFALHGDGTVVLIAAGRANHAGVASVSSSASYGIEATGPTPTGSTGPGSFAYADYVRLAAAICDEHGWQTGANLGHLEIARPVGRKVDAAFGSSLSHDAGVRGMQQFRVKVAAYRKGGGTPSTPSTPTAPDDVLELFMAMTDADEDRMAQAIKRGVAAAGAQPGQPNWGETLEITNNVLKDIAAALRELTAATKAGA